MTWLKYICLGFVVLLLHQGASALEKHAFLVGVDYTGDDRLPEVPTAQSDIALLTASFKAAGYSVVALNNPTFEEFQSAQLDYVSTLEASEETALSVFYFTGHGYARSKYSRNAIFLQDSGWERVPDVDSKGTYLDDIARSFARPDSVIGSLLFVDAGRSLKSNQMSARPMPATRSITGPGLDDPEDFAAYDITSTIFAARPGTNQRRTDAENTEFARAVSDLIGEAGLTTTELMVKVQKTVQDRTGFELNPWLQQGLTSEIVLNPVADPNAPIEPDHKIAYLIGNSAYDEKVGPLANPTEDVEILAAALRENGFEIFNDSEGLDASDKSRDDILTGLFLLRQRLDDLPNDTLVVFYFSGHGFAEPNSKRSYLVPIDQPELTSLQAKLKSVPMDEVENTLVDPTDDKQYVFIIDACRNELESANAVQKGMKPVAYQPGVLLSYSTLPGATASDGIAEDLGGPFAQALVTAFDQPAVDIEDVLKSARFNLRKEHDQTA
jgi:uncharacterized caspase-like protein